MLSRDTLIKVCQGSLALLFLWAGIVKLMNPGAFVMALTNYHILPLGLTPFLAYIIPLSECLLAILLITPTRSFWPILTVGLFSSIFLIFNASAMIRGIDLECGCFGTASGRVNITTLALNLFMIMASCIVGSQRWKMKRVLQSMAIGTVATVLLVTLSIKFGQGELSYQPIPSSQADQDVQVRIPPTPTIAIPSPTDESIHTSQAPVTFSPPRLDLGEVPLKKSVRHTVLITNHTDHPVTVTAIGLGCHCIKVWLPSVNLAPQHTSEMIVKYTAGPMTGAFELGIGLKTKELAEPLKYVVTVTVPER